MNEKRPSLRSNTNTQFYIDDSTHLLINSIGATQKPVLLALFLDTWAHVLLCLTPLYQYYGSVAY
uniref:Uncharacterized protein n=1 Tax=Arundo donax TaxID=35708 RepID=A0A0A9GF06_ARUDO